MTKVIEKFIKDMEIRNLSAGTPASLPIIGTTTARSAHIRV